MRDVNDRSKWYSTRRLTTSSLSNTALPCRGNVIASIAGGCDEI